MTVLWSPGALADLRRIRGHIAQDAPGNAAVVVARIRATVLTIEEYPYRGRIGKRRGLREVAVPRTPYVITYRIAGSVAQIVRVYHGAQDRPR